MLLRARYLAVLGALLGVWRAFPQTPPDIFREASHVDQLVNEGSYVQASRTAAAILDRLHVWQRDDQALVFLSYLGKATVEMGMLGQSSRILNAAENLSSRIWDQHYVAAFVREKAAFYYAVAEYDAAAAAAAKAYQLAREQNYYRERVEYCRAIQALAMLRLGNVQEAERLALAAVKAAPKKPGRHPVFAPRILYAACLVESYAGKTADAEPFCSRGIAIAAQSKKETRDLSLGYLTLAEAHLQAGNLERSREAAQKCVDLTARMFGAQHQDMVSALDLLATISRKQGDKAAARARAEEAMEIAVSIFGEGSPGAGMAARTLHEIEESDSRSPR